MIRKLHGALIGVLVWAALLTTWHIYQTGLPGIFVLDDFSSLERIGEQVDNWPALQEYLAAPGAGPTGRPLAQLSFLLDDFAWPSTAEPFKRTNLLLHLLTGCVLFLFSTAVIAVLGIGSTRTVQWCALLVTGVWLVHPLNVSTVGYVVQRMTLLSAIFMLAGGYCYLLARRNLQTQPLPALTRMAATTATFTLLALLCKENGALLPLLLLIIEVTILSHRKAGISALLPLHKLWLGLLTLSSALLLAYCFSYGIWQARYEHRDFTLGQRLATQPIILWDYLRYLLSYRTAGLGLFHDDWPTYSWGAWQARLAVFGFVGMLFLCWQLRIKRPELGFGVLWFLAGHAMEASAIPLELYFEHRNYLPAVGPIIAITVTVTRWASSQQAVVKAALLPAGAIWIGLSALLTQSVAQVWANQDQMFGLWHIEHPDSVRAWHSVIGAVENSSSAQQTFKILAEAESRFPEHAAFPLRAIEFGCRLGIAPEAGTVSSLASNASQYRLNVATQVAITSIVTSMKSGQCLALAEELVTLLAAAPEMESASAQPGLLARYFGLKASVHVLQGDRYADYINSLLTWEELSPDSTIAERLARSQLAVGNLEEAMKWRDTAQQRKLREFRPWGPEAHVDLNKLGNEIRAAMRAAEAMSDAPATSTKYQPRPLARIQHSKA